MIMVVLFIRSIGTAFHSQALSAVTTLLVPEEQLTKCAGYSQSLQSVTIFLVRLLRRFYILFGN